MHGFRETDFSKTPYTEEEFMEALGKRVAEMHRKIDAGEVEFVSPDDLP